MSKKVMCNNDNNNDNTNNKIYNYVFITIYNSAHNNNYELTCTKSSIKHESNVTY